ncbi:cyclin, putative [Theileria equi strain WA]|uniref:Cyclin, putative n=1 Tax=Theileria equi strain WA TaxID=1537102 RepID=L0B257_THEEQ|nr:cyclin, putative [Theileria equi strain WA]AFZ81326.1 cyclin, putative [Theileria equi strain WA]|eukprot:XP_004830992.1 cyclin, putative [Theileria equi strain WA]
MESVYENGQETWPRNSTHYKNWLIDSPNTLQRIRLDTYNNALQKIKYKLVDLDVPTFEEEQWLVKYYSYQLSKFLATNHLKTTVKETALTFFNRFFLRKSLLEYDPRLIMFTCTTLAIKLEDMWRTVYVDKLLGHINNLDIAKVFEMEPIVCEVLDFNLLVLHTGEPLYTIQESCLQYLKDSLEINDELVGEHLNVIISISKQVEGTSMQMHENPELLFMHTPTQLALANFLYHCKTNLQSVISVETFILKKFLGGNDTKLVPLLSALNNINVKYDEFMAFRDKFSQEVEKAGSILDKYLKIYGI